MVHLNNDWDQLLQEEFQKQYYQKLREFLKQEYKTKRIYPSMHDIFHALKLTSYEDVKVVLLGQDPYHGPGQAHGLCFSVPNGVKKPPSLENIFKELSQDLGIPTPIHGNLEAWAKRGVLLLNTVLTVREGEANSHQGKGWELFTDSIIDLLNKRERPMVFLLWGANAKAKTKLITNPNHMILTAAHPSPLSAYNGFYGCGHFHKTNAFLHQFGESINWDINT